MKDAWIERIQQFIESRPMQLEIAKTWWKSKPLGIALCNYKRNRILLESKPEGDALCNYK